MRALLAAVADGSVDPDEAALRLKTAPFTDLGYAKVDHQRGVRQGVAEVVYGAGKTPAQMAGIVASMRAAGQERVLVTRLAPEAADELRALLQASDPLAAEAFAYHELPRLGLVGGLPEPDGHGPVV